MIKTIRLEHLEIKRLLNDLRRFIDSNFDYNKFTETFKEFVRFWNVHEKKEEALFSKFENTEFVRRMNFEHKAIKGYRKVIAMALETHYEPYIKVTLEIDGKMMINRLNEHILREEEFLSKLENRLIKH